MARQSRNSPSIPRARTGISRTSSQNYQMYQIACRLDLPPAVAAKVRDPREFPLTNLERIYRSTEAAEFLGVTFDENRQLSGHIDIAEFKKGLGRIVTDVATGKVNSRNLNSAKELGNLLGDFAGDTPNKSKRGSFTLRNLVSGPAGKAGALPKLLPANPKPARPQVALISRTFVCGVQDARINAMLKELKRLPVEDYPNAVALALRGFLDLAVGTYSDRTGATAKIIAKVQAKNPNQKRGEDWYPTLRQMLRHLKGVRRS